MDSRSTRLFHRLPAVGWLVAVGLLASTGAETQPAPDSACPTCAQISTERVIDPGAAAGGASASYVRCGEEAVLTSAIAAEFGLEPLEAYLEQPNVVAGHSGEGGVMESSPPAERSLPVELRFDVGEFRYYKKSVDVAACDDSIWADAHVSVRIGNGLLSFEADGRLWKRKNEPWGHYYADADVATPTGSYRPNLDLARVHTVAISVALYVAPGHLRGSITPEVRYFRDAAQLRRHRQGAWGEYAERAVLFRLGFPSDRCEDHELPFAHDWPVERLGDQSADVWRSRAIGLIGDTAIVNAVWKEGGETEVAVELGAPVAGTVCLSTSIGVGTHTAPASELALRIPLAGRLRSTDGRLDMPLDELIVGIDAEAVVRVTLRSRVPTTRLSEAPRRAALGANADLLSARVSYDAEREPEALDGIVELLEHTTPGSYRRVDCVAFPRGGKADVSDCQSVYVPPPLR